MTSAKNQKNQKTEKTAKTIAKNEKNQKNQKNEKTAKTGKKIVRTTTRKAKPYSIKVDGKTLNCRTACKDIGLEGFPMADEKDPTVFLKKCKKCPAKTQAVCLEKSIALRKEAEKIEKAAKKKTGVKRTKKPFGCIFDCFLTGTPKADSVALAIEKGLAEKTAKRFVNDIYFVSRTALGMGRAIGKGGLIERYMNWALYGIGEEPTGCKSTIGFCKNLIPEIKAAEEMA